MSGFRQKRSFKIICVAAVIILIFLLVMGYKLSYKKEIERIDKVDALLK